MRDDTGERVQRLLAEEAFVRSLASALVSGEDERNDVAQQTWLHALRAAGSDGLGDVRSARAWLTRIAQRVASNLRRGARRRDVHERATAVHGLAPSSAELAEREERRRALVAAVDRLPEPLREAVLLRWFEGLPPRRIAALLGVPVATVWNRLRRALQLLREALDAEHGDRRAWLLPLAGVVRPSPSLVPVLGVLAMTAKTKIALAAAAALAVAALFAWWPDAPSSSVSQSPPANAVEPAVVELAPPAAAQRDEAAPSRVEAPTAARPATGTLVVRAVRKADRTPLPGIAMFVLRGAGYRFPIAEEKTDGDGAAHFELTPGKVAVLDDRGGHGGRKEVVAGAETELVLEYQGGITVKGIVVDAAGAPVAGAIVEYSVMAYTSRDVEPITTTGADGRFELLECCAACLVGARAEGHAASPLRFATGKPGAVFEVRLQLGGPGGAVEGTVVGPDGRAVAGAMVVVGEGETCGIGGRAGDMPPVPAIARTDAQGRFRAIGLVPGVRLVRARSPKLAPWKGECAVAANSVAALRIALDAGGTCRGVVRDEAGAPCSGVRVSVGDRPGIERVEASSREDGTFVLEGLAAGTHEVKAYDDERGVAAATVAVAAGGETTCELVLSNGLQLHGRVLGPDGKPAMARVRATARADEQGPFWSADASMRKDGTFTFSRVPPGRLLRVVADGSGAAHAWKTNVDPRAGELVLQLPAIEPPSAHVTGRLLAPDGAPMRNVHVYGQRISGDMADGMTDAGGRFRFGPLVPGRWHVFATPDAHVHPTWSWRELAKDETWDLGDVRLETGGTLVVEVTGEPAPAKAALLSVAGADGRGIRSGYEVKDDVRRLGPLPCGELRLRVAGDGVRQQNLPVTIRAGEETKISVRTEGGVRQRFDFAVPAGFDHSRFDSGRIVVTRGDVEVATRWISGGDGDPFQSVVWLAPGSYSFRATIGALTGNATFTVGETESVPLRVVLQ